MSLLLVFIAAPTVVAMTVWASLTATRLLKHPVDHVLRRMDPVLVQMARLPVRPPVVAGEADTPPWFPGRDTWREFHHAHYDYKVDRSGGLPESWWENVVLRQN